MAHFAELKSNNIVRRVIVVANRELIDYRFEHHDPVTYEEEQEVTLEDDTIETQTVTVEIPSSSYVPYESEDKGIAFCQSLFGADTVWKQTSYNGTFRKNFAGKGFTYDADRDAFIAPQPFNTWVLNEDTCRWEAPVAYPDDGEEYVWNDNKGEWELRAV
mgnify:CR=1 FL=1